MAASAAATTLSAAFSAPFSSAICVLSQLPYIVLPFFHLSKACLGCLDMKAASSVLHLLLAY